MHVAFAKDGCRVSCRRCAFHWWFPTVDRSTIVKLWRALTLTAIFSDSNVACDLSSINILLFCLHLCCLFPVWVFWCFHVSSCCCYSQSLMMLTLSPPPGVIGLKLQFLRLSSSHSCSLLRHQPCVICLQYELMQFKFLCITKVFFKTKNMLKKINLYGCSPYPQLPFNVISYKFILLCSTRPPKS